MMKEVGVRKAYALLSGHGANQDASDPKNSKSQKGECFNLICFGRSAAAAVRAERDVCGDAVSRSGPQRHQRYALRVSLSLG